MTDVQRATLRMLRIPPTDLPAPGTVAAADLRTSMCDARIALVLALGRRPDPCTGHVLPEAEQLPLFEVAA